MSVLKYNKECQFCVESFFDNEPLEKHMLSEYHTFQSEKKSMVDKVRLFYINKIKISNINCSDNLLNKYCKYLPINYYPPSTEKKQHKRGRLKSAGAVDDDDNNENDDDNNDDNDDSDDDDDNNHDDNDDDDDHDDHVDRRLRIIGSFPSEKAFEMIVKKLKDFNLNLDQYILGLLNDGAMNSTELLSDGPTLIKKLVKLLNIVYQFCHSNDDYFAVGYG
ncbi:uncharacterized membrane protein-like [Hydra vulgaris]|uniref:uncharacterized membrane protein-like n=1 Tax=Hydra vulgaris TaxID=6087 RepID=UPI0032EA6350